MAIYKIVLFLLLVAAPLKAGAATLEAFLTNTSAPPEVKDLALRSEKAVEKCVEANGKIFCIYGRPYPNIAKNPQARQAILQSLPISGRQFMISYLGDRIRANNLRQPREAYETLKRNASHEASKLRDLEFVTFSRGNWCGVVTMLPLASARVDLGNLYASPSFITAYCQTLLPKAQHHMESRQYGLALETLKELHDLKFANVEAYLLAARAFMMENQAEETKKVATELLREMSNKLDAHQAEMLGDIFLQLKMDKEAEETFLIASNLLNGK